MWASYSTLILDARYPYQLCRESQLFQYDHCRSEDAFRVQSTEGTNQLLLQQPLVKKVESGTDILNIYLEDLSKKT